ncbi:hypothetical protein RB598_006916 [Gaeumannomyces tritici]
MSYGYGGDNSNPYDQRDSPAGAGGYNQGARPPPAQFGQGPRPGGGNRFNNGGGSPAMGHDDYGSAPASNVEMASLAQNAGSFAQQNSDPNFVLNECRSIDEGVGGIEQNLNQLRMLQDRSLNEADATGSQTQRQLDQLSSETMAMYRTLTDRVRKVKSRPEATSARNAAQVNRVDRRLKQAINGYQQIESGFRQKSRDQLERQYRYVRPDADEREVRDAVEDAANGGGQIFQQALMQSDRRGQARAVLSNVQDRHEQLKKIEQQMIELAQLFQDMDTLIVQQEVQVAQIEQKGEEVVENLDKGNEEIHVAVETAKKTRKKKWICLGIVVAIVVIIAIGVGAWIAINKPFAQPAAASPAAPATTTAAVAPAKRSVVKFNGERPVSAVYAQSKIVSGSAGANVVPLSHFAGRAREIVRRYVLAAEEKPAVEPEQSSKFGANAINLGGVGGGGRFNLESLAAGVPTKTKTKRLALPLGRSFDVETRSLVPGRSTPRMIESQRGNI